MLLIYLLEDVKIGQFSTYVTIFTTKMEMAYQFRNSFINTFTGKSKELRSSDILE